MSKLLRVINPFFVMEVGDTFELNAEGDRYVSEHNEEFHKVGDKENAESSYSSVFAITIEYAENLIKEGFLEEVPENKDVPFVNVFDEIKSLLDKYTFELNNLDKDMSSFPECMKLERRTVLTNLITVLTHLKNLKK